MTFSKAEIAPGVVADARRALWLEEERTLVVADLHLGYAWAHRYAGQMLPISVREDSVDRLGLLQGEYRPARTVFLGDIVHRAVPVAPLKNLLSALVEQLSKASELTFIRGNHDRQLENLMAKVAPGIPLQTELRLGSNLLLHGDLTPVKRAGRTILGHEHPAVWIGDGAATGVRCPCFLVGDGVIVLPAFSQWAAGSVFGRHEFLSPIARESRFKLALAVMGQKLLPMEL